VSRKVVAQLRRRLGIVFQDFRLLEDRSAEANVAFALEVIGTKRDQIGPRVQRALMQVGLSSNAKAYPRELSGGEQQRVAIARAIAKRPDVLLCDEPTGALDYATGKIVLEALAGVNRELGTTVAVITHNAAIAAMADRVVRMSSGRIAGIERNARKASPSELSW
jgi:putative ABC transport system ATP-binding protein